MPPPDDARPVDSAIDVVERLAELPAEDWNALTAGRYPFLTHEFLVAAESSGCVSPATGWRPRHLVLRDAGGKLRAAMPLYEKSHSWGEFVFDWAWASAYQRAGVSYYPKLVSAAPFTPAPSPRLLLADRSDHEAGAALVRAAVALARDEGLSSLHVQFPLPEEHPMLIAAGLRLRKDCQFHWHNDGYRSFEDFLQRLNARKRKKAKRDRRRVAEQGIGFRRLGGRDVDAALWSDVHALVSLTFLRRGSMPYLDESFFCEFARSRPDDILVILAERGRQTLAAGVFYRGADTLYGRYWGSDGHYDALHFETCYYQGIDFCIRHGIARFEPGTQGEHKISRGFVPVTTWSAHWLARPEFFAAIGDYLR
ncbi:MAG: GNAT family N-acetyltransferase, partial [Woeseiaceae bacterium]|nr:GNAT family N-acetyltransferase [Woeseiaceae bacterium]